MMMLLLLPSLASFKSPSLAHISIENLEANHFFARWSRHSLNIKTGPTEGVNEGKRFVAVDIESVGYILLIKHPEISPK